MSWRVVVITSNAKLDLSLNHLVIRRETVVKINLSEIRILMIESTAVSMTAALMVELVKRKIKVVLCDEKCNPNCELLPYYGSHDTSSKIRTQIQWRTYEKQLVWTEIVRDKIVKQKDFLKQQGREEYQTLENYINEMAFADETNREGHAAKVYFNALFGQHFSRSDESVINAALNYGYAIILSAFSREIVANGYLTQIGLFHDNMFNNFNLASDLMEPYRILVDRKVLSMDLISFEREEKMEMVNLLNHQVLIDGKKQYVTNAISIYTRSIFEAINEKDISQIKLYRYEL